MNVESLTNDNKENCSNVALSEAPIASPQVVLPTSSSEANVAVPESKEAATNEEDLISQDTEKAFPPSNKQETKAIASIPERQASSALDIDEHRISVEELCTRYGVDFNQKDAFKSMVSFHLYLYIYYTIASCELFRD